jgi:hypothetical protein
VDLVLIVAFWALLLASSAVALVRIVRHRTIEPYDRQSALPQWTRRWIFDA